MDLPRRWHPRSLRQDPRRTLRRRAESRVSPHRHRSSRRHRLRPRHPHRMACRICRSRRHGTPRIRHLLPPPRRSGRHRERHALNRLHARENARSHPRTPHCRNPRRSRSRRPPRHPAQGRLQRSRRLRGSHRLRRALHRIRRKSQRPPLRSRLLRDQDPLRNHPSPANRRNPPRRRHQGRRRRNHQRPRSHGPQRPGTRRTRRRPRKRLRQREIPDRRGKQIPRARNQPQPRPPSPDRTHRRRIHQSRSSRSFILRRHRRHPLHVPRRRSILRTA